MGGEGRGTRASMWHAIIGPDLSARAGARDLPACSPPRGREGAYVGSVGRLRLLEPAPPHRNPSGLGLAAQPREESHGERSRHRRPRVGSGVVGEDLERNAPILELWYGTTGIAPDFDSLHHATEGCRRRNSEVVVEPQTWGRPAPDAPFFGGAWRFEPAFSLDSRLQIARSGEVLKAETSETGVVGFCEALNIPELAAGEDRKLRLRATEDPVRPVRQEIEAAVALSVPIIPLTAAGVRVPKPSELPPSLARLSGYNGVPLRAPPDLKKDLDGLVAAPNAGNRALVWRAPCHRRHRC